MEPNKIPCPTHGPRFVHVKGPYGSGEWHQCSKCTFKKWVRLNGFWIIAGAVSLGIYVKNVLIYLRIT